MTFQEIIYGADGGIGVITLNRPAYRNAQGYRMLDEIDAAFDLARADEAVRVVVVRGAGGVFSTGHDLGTEEGMEYRRALGAKPGIQTYDQFKRYNLDLLLKWRNFEKPTVAMVEGYCIYAGWMLAAAMDVVFAAEDAEFLAGMVEYMSIPWDIGVRRAKELIFESRFISAAEAAQYGLVNRVLPKADLERETMGWAARVAQNSPEVLRMGKLSMNKAQDAQGFSNAVEDTLGDYCAMMWMPGVDLRMEGQNRLLAVDLAVTLGKRGLANGLGRRLSQGRAFSLDGTGPGDLRRQGARWRGPESLPGRLAVLADEDLVEVPDRHGGLAQLGLGPFVEGVAACVLHIDLGGHGEVHRKARLAEGLDLGLGPRLLAAELVAGHAQDDQPLVPAGQE